MFETHITYPQCTSPWVPPRSQTDREAARGYGLLLSCSARSHPEGKAAAGRVGSAGVYCKESSPGIPA
ncbi:hypothetical protein UPYG_G00351510 [Umbra pygmaea]|uniref:Uncharacterized protein n=1 Tax=Umbra pygmaea TaxID=75934 RepID=A0ABD0WD06_UMBPY